MPALDTTGLTLHIDFSDPTLQYASFGPYGGANPPADGAVINGSQDVGNASIFGLRSLFGTNGGLRQVAAINGLDACEFSSASTRCMRACKDDNSANGLTSDFFANNGKTLFVNLAITGDGTNVSGSVYKNSSVFEDEAQWFGLYHKTASGPVDTLHAHNSDVTDDSIGITVTRNILTTICIRHDGVNLAISQDQGSESTVASGNTGTMSNVFRVGLGNFGAGLGWNGLITEFALYNIYQAGSAFTDSYQYFVDRKTGGAAASQFPALTVAI